MKIDVLVGINDANGEFRPSFIPYQSELVCRPIYHGVAIWCTCGVRHFGSYPMAII